MVPDRVGSPVPRSTGTYGSDGSAKPPSTAPRDIRGQGWTRSATGVMLRRQEALLRDEFLTISDVADMLKISERTVRRLQGRGELPSYRVGSQLRFRRADVERWIESCREAAGRGDD